MEVRIAAAKIRKYATSESGDTLEVIERPGGGLSVVLADGQRSGRSAKAISNIVVRKVISLLAEGVRDGAAARAASDALFTEKGGRVQATLNILSVDLRTQTLVILRNNPAPVLVMREGSHLDVLDSESTPVGLYANTRPVITEIPLQVGLLVVMFTDGLLHAGERYGQPMDVITCLRALVEDADDPPPAQAIADALLNHALELDQGRPADDISVVVLQVVPHSGDPIRKMSVQMPI